MLTETHALELLVQVVPATPSDGKAHVVVHRARPVEWTPADGLHAPILPSSDVSRLRPGQMELSLEVRNVIGEVVASYGWPFRSHSFVDWQEGEKRYAALRVTRADEADLRSVQIPIGPDALVLVFRSLEVVFGPDRTTTIHQTPLAAFSLGPGVPHAGWLAHLGVSIEPLPWAPAWVPGRHRPPIDLGKFGPLTRIPGGHVEGVDQVGTAGPPESRFNVVLTGDGFAEAELPAFSDIAIRVIGALRQTPPYEDLDAHINWHVVRVASDDSGIPACSDGPNSCPGKARRTYFGVEGCQENSQARLYLGTTRQDRIIEAVEHAVAWEQCDLVILVANCAARTGHAFPAFKTAIVALVEIEDAVAHECGHVIADLAEEWVVPLATPDPDPARVHLNMTTLGKVGASVKAHLLETRRGGGPALAAQLAAWRATDSVWWKDVLPPPILSMTGEFRAVHVPGDAILHNTPVVPPKLATTTGAFWGCQEVLDENDLRTSVEELVGPSSPELVDALTGAGKEPGSFFYRPATNCRMRSPTVPYCHVCEYVLRRRILLRCRQLRPLGHALAPLPQASQD